MTSKQFLYIAIATFITVIIWVTFDLINPQKQSTISPDIDKVIQPLNPNFDQEVLNDLGN